MKLGSVLQLLKVMIAHKYGIVDLKTDMCIIIIGDLQLPVELNPSCLQTTTASLALQKSSQTVPHTLLLQISTRPSVIAEPPTRRRTPLVVELHV